MSAAFRLTHLLDSASHSEGLPIAKAIRELMPGQGESAEAVVMVKDESELTDLEDAFNSA